MHTTLATGDLLTINNQNVIRRAFKKGERKVVVKEREFTMERKGDYILIKPVLGRLPMAQIQIEVGPSKKLQKWANTPVDESKRPRVAGGFKRSNKKK